MAPDKKDKKKEKPLHADHRARMQDRVRREGLPSLAAHEVLEYLLYFAIPGSSPRCASSNSTTSCRSAKAAPARCAPKPTASSMSAPSSSPSRRNAAIWWP